MDKNVVQKQLIVKAQGRRCFECAGILNENDLGGCKIINQDTRPMIVALCSECVFGTISREKKERIQSAYKNKIFI